MVIACFWNGVERLVFDESLLSKGVKRLVGGDSLFLEWGGKVSFLKRVCFPRGWKGWLVVIACFWNGVERIVTIVPWFFDRLKS